MLELLVSLLIALYSLGFGTLSELCSCVSVRACGVMVVLLLLCFAFFNFNFIALTTKVYFALKYLQAMAESVR
jgi:hypothetical protein